jgi:malonyl CoA-acyl carrier protein transacylase
MSGQGVVEFKSTGPGTVLTNLIKKIQQDTTA